jgi:hypothetical protein
VARSFASVRDLRAAALVIVAALPFMSHIEQLATLTLCHAVPAIFPFREFPAAGGLATNLNGPVPIGLTRMSRAEI